MIPIVLPFSMDALQGAVRRYLARPVLDIAGVVPRRIAPESAVYQLEVTYHVESGSRAADDSTDTLDLVYKAGSVQVCGATDEGSDYREAQFYSTLAGQLPVRTPRLLLTAADVVGEPTLPLVAGSSGSRFGGFSSYSGRNLSDPLLSDDWILMEALPSDGHLLRGSWTAEHYRKALTTLAELHASHWGRPPDRDDYPWVWSPTGHHTEMLVEDSRLALLELEGKSWCADFFPEGHLRAWLNVLEEPWRLLDTLAAMPQTLIHGDYWPGNIAMRAEGPAVFDWQFVGAGPAVYDLASFYSLSRWWFGRLPLSLAEIRGHYLRELNLRLGEDIDRYAFDLGIDTARAWRFAISWPRSILDHHSSLMSARHRLQNTVLEPSFASLRRCLQ